MSIYLTTLVVERECHLSTYMRTTSGITQLANWEIKFIFKEVFMNIENLYNKNISYTRR